LLKPLEGKEMTLSRFPSRLVVFAFLLLTPLRFAVAQEWLPIGGALRNVSGMAFVESSGADKSIFLVVHDNKKETEARAGLIVVERNKPVTYTPLLWPREIPLANDLESVTTVPGKPGTFLLVESGDKLGDAPPAPKAYLVTLNAAKNGIAISKVLDLPVPPAHTNLEGFSLQRIGDVVLAVWGHRGKNSEPGTVYWAPFDAATFTFGAVQSVPVTLPWPTESVRHISDLKLDASGALFTSAASDPGDEGPFSSALYLTGIFHISGTTVVFSPNPAPTPLYRFPHHKVEGFEFVPGRDGGIIFGTDDESLGASVFINW
jgi:hypothetical protein